MPSDQYEVARRAHEELFEAWYQQFQARCLMGEDVTQGMLHQVFEDVAYVLCPAPPQEPTNGKHFAITLTIDHGCTLGSLLVALQSASMVTRHLTLVGKVHLTFDGFEPEIVHGHDGEPF